MKIVFALCLIAILFVGILTSAEAQYASGQTRYSSTKIVLKPIASVIKKDDTVTFAGQLLTSNGKYVIQQATVYIKDDVDFGADDYILALTTDKNGKFSGNWKASIRYSVAWDFYAVFEGDNQFGRSRSDWPSTVVLPKSYSNYNNQPSSYEPKPSYSNSNYQRTYQDQSKQTSSDTYTQTYRVYTSPLPNWATNAGNVMYDATKAWEDANPGLKFYKATSENNADFTVQWVKEFGVEHVGYAYGKKFVEVGLGDSNCDERWHPYSPKYAAFIMAHEIGHILGQEHDSDPNSLMYPIALNLEYGVVEEEFTLTKGYAQFVSLCTIKDVTSYQYAVSTSDKKSGFDVYFVPSVAELNKWGRGESFSYYSDSGCFGNGYTSFSGTCKGISKESGLLIIMDDYAAPLTKVNVKLLEK